MLAGIPPKAYPVEDRNLAAVYAMAKAETAPPMITRFAPAYRVT